MILLTAYSVHTCFVQLAALTMWLIFILQWPDFEVGRLTLEGVSSSGARGHSSRALGWFSRIAFLAFRLCVMSPEGCSSCEKHDTYLASNDPTNTI